MRALRDAGFRGQQINVLAMGLAEAKRIALGTGADAEGEQEHHRLRDLLDTLIGLGAVLVPAVGPDVAVTTTPASMESAAAGSGLGGVAGTLVGLGVPVDAAVEYDRQVAAGTILVVVVTAPEDRGKAERILVA